MTTETIKSDYELTREAVGIAKDIMEEAQRHGGDDWLTELQDNPTDPVHEFVDGHEFVIYYHHAKEICCNCNTDDGEEAWRDCGFEFVSFDKLCCQITYFELCARTSDALETLICDAVEALEEVAA
jgi:hypothetical protein